MDDKTVVLVYGSDMGKLRKAADKIRQDNAQYHVSVLTRDSRHFDEADVEHADSVVILDDPFDRVGKAYEAQKKLGKEIDVRKSGGGAFRGKKRKTHIDADDTTTDGSAGPTTNTGLNLQLNAEHDSDKPEFDTGRERTLGNTGRLTEDNDDENAEAGEDEGAKAGENENESGAPGDAKAPEEMTKEELAEEGDKYGLELSMSNTKDVLVSEIKKARRKAGK